VEIRDCAMVAAQAAADKKATDIVVLDVAKALVITDYFVIATGASDTQVRAIADEMEQKVEAAGLKVIGREGAAERTWVLVDFGDLVIHVFRADTREFYRLEKLWGDVPRLELPESVTGPVVVKSVESDEVAEPEAGATAS
jgi:ribosome-associated protein